MREGARPEPPVVVVLAAPGSPVLREVLAGLEEEGVPARVGLPAGNVDAVTLAELAAASSPLEVGVGITADGAVAVGHRTLPLGTPVRRSGPGASAAEARSHGHDAARVVVGVPLSDH